MNHPQDNIPLLIQARRAQQASDFTTAQTLLQEVLQQEPDHVEALHRLGFICVQSGEWDKAHEWIKKALKIAPEAPVLHLHLANICRHQQWYDDAAIAYQKAIELSPDNSEMHNNYGLLHYERRYFDEAKACFLKALALRPDYLEAMYNLALTHHAQDDMEEAIACLMALIAAAPMHASAHFLMGKILLAHQKYQEANQYFQLAASLQPTQTQILASIIKCWLEKDRYAEAKVYCKRFLQHLPNHTEMLYNMGIIESRLDQIESAMSYYESVLAIEPKHFQALNNLGVLYLQQHSVETAKYYFEKALREQPDDVSVQYTLSALSGDFHYDAAPRTYITSLFDGYANHFEKHVTLALDYRVPEVLEQQLESLVDPIPEDWRVVDLGCGTGLCGERFREWAEELIGIDLSSKMIEMARQKDCYDELSVGENIEYLRSQAENIDLLLAADVLVYQGELRHILTAAAQALVPNGLFAFSTEVFPGEGYTMLSSGRFAHATDYVHDVAEHAGFRILAEVVVPTRRQQNNWVAGRCVVLQKLG